MRSRQSSGSDPVDNQEPDPGRDEDLTGLLNGGAGAGSGIDAAFEQVYGALRRLAQHHLGRERQGHTLSATALVNEVYLKLAAQDRARWANRAQFFSVASTAMRRILVNHARDRGRQKRGGGAERVDLDQPEVGLTLAEETRWEEVLTVDRLLGDLERLDPRAVRVTECRFFAGYTNEETAEALGVSAITVKRAWRLARAWMARELAGETDPTARNGVSPAP